MPPRRAEAPGDFIYFQGRLFFGRFKPQLLQ
jgi:hypothetical protein